MKNISGLVLLSITASMLAAQTADSTSRDWPVVNGPGATHYSTLTQIDRKNVGKLQTAWQFDSGDEFKGSELECNPIVLDGVLYATTPKLRVIALNAATGKLLWAFDPHDGHPVTAKQRNRGLTYWGQGDERRLLSASTNICTRSAQRLDSQFPAFGQEGRIDLLDGLGENAKGLTIQATSPGVVYKDLLIQGTLSRRRSSSRPGTHSRFRRAHGQIRWIFHTIPQPGEFGYKTWPKDAYTESAA